MFWFVISIPDGSHLQGFKYEHDASHVLWPLGPREFNPFEHLREIMAHQVRQLSTTITRMGVYPYRRVRLVESTLRRTGAGLAESSEVREIRNKSVYTNKTTAAACMAFDKE